MQAHAVVSNVKRHLPRLLKLVLTNSIDFIFPSEEKKSMTSVASDGYKRVFDIPKELQEKAHIKSMAQYEEMYKRSIEDPEGFWGEMAEQNLDFYKKWDKVLDYDWSGDIRVEWFKGR